MNIYPFSPQPPTDMGDIRSVFYLRASIKFCPRLLHFCPVRMKFGARDVHKKLLNGWEFRENRHSESHTILSGKNEQIHTFIYRPIWVKIGIRHLQIMLLNI
jgi:hypothetical protein